jgi:hypothetical protein
LVRWNCPRFRFPAPASAEIKATGTAKRRMQLSGLFASGSSGPTQASRFAERQDDGIQGTIRPPRAT